MNPYRIRFTGNLIFIQSFRNSKLGRVSKSERRFSASKSHNNQDGQQHSWWSAKTWSGVLIRRTIRAVQVGVLSMTIYQYGYQTGVLSYMNNHEEIDKALIATAMQKKGVLLDKNSEDSEEAKQLSRALAKISQSSGPRLKTITIRLIHAANDWIDAKIEENKYLKANSMERNDQSALIDLDKDLVKLLRAKQVLKSGRWDIVCVPSASVNAFVMSLVPHKIFIMSGLIAALSPTDDELAMIISHELSHALFDHGGEGDMSFQAIMVAMQLVILSIFDPTGFTILALDYALNTFRNILNAAYSREHEEEADLVGLEIGMLACFNMQQGANIMKKLADYQKKASGSTDYQSTSWLDDHPASIERYASLVNMEKEIQHKINKMHPDFKMKHMNGLPQCKTLVGDLKRAGLWYWFG